MSPRPERALRLARRLAIVTSVLLLIGAGVRAAIRHSSTADVRRDNEAFKSEAREALHAQVGDELKLLKSQLAEIDTIVPPAGSSDAGTLARDFWSSGFAVTSVGPPTLSVGEDLVDHHFKVVAHSGRLTWLEALDALANKPRIYSVERIHVTDPANPDAPVELEVVTWTRQAAPTLERR